MSKITSCIDIPKDTEVEGPKMHSRDAAVRNPTEQGVLQNGKLGERNGYQAEPSSKLMMASSIVRGVE